MPSPSLTLLGLMALSTSALSSASENHHHHYHLLLSSDYAAEVCSPNTTATTDDDASSPVPPCIQVVTIEAACTTPNSSTSPTEWLDHAECMCGGSYFEDWEGCQDCLSFHGLRTEREGAFYASVMSIASHSLCDFYAGVSGAAQPTASFAALYNSVAATAAQPTTGATIGTDQAPGETAVSLYFTSSGTLASAGAGNATMAGANQTFSSSGPAQTSVTATSASGSAKATNFVDNGTFSTKTPGGLLLGLAAVVIAVGL